MIRCIRVEIRKNEAHTLNGAYPAWELPILEAVHGPDNVKVVGEKLINRAAPDAHDEFTRLVNRYGRSRDEQGNYSTHYAHMVYGQMGVQKIAEAIAENGNVPPPEGSLVDDEPNSSVGG